MLKSFFRAQIGACLQRNFDLQRTLRITEDFFNLFERVLEMLSVHYDYLPFANFKSSNKYSKMLGILL